MKRTMLLASVTLALATFASAASYTVKLTSPVVIDGKEWKAGEYKVDVKDTTAVIRNGKESAELKVKTESTAKKYGATTVRFSQTDGKNNLEEIRLGGTKTKLISDSPKTANGGE
jgi:hypothetical protein